MSVSYATWPFSCPVSWVETPVPSLLRSEVDDGYPKVRRRFTKAWVEIQASFYINWEDAQAWRDFFRLDCQDGSLPFYIEDPYTEEQRLVRWKEPPSSSGSADTKPVFQVSGTLEEVFS